MSKHYRGCFVSSASSVAGGIVIDAVRLCACLHTRRLPTFFYLSLVVSVGLLACYFLTFYNYYNNYTANNPILCSLDLLSHLRRSSHKYSLQLHLPGRQVGCLSQI
ncbi:hypothetical protein F5B20DRAFT_539761 [Whalleya microplaca]|nr:hypothetical protein F5B20DRAFT_539761 [Whalleya microplaca]